MKRSTIGQLCGALALAVFAWPSAVEAQPPGPGGPGFGGNGGILGLVTRDEVQQEIQLVDEQREKVMQIAEEARETMRDEMRTMFSEMRDLSEDERRERFGEIRSKMEEMTADIDARLKKSLLPHQYERLKQIDLQTRMRQRGESGLSSGAIADALELTDAQREKLQQRAEEVREELREKIRQAQAEAREKMMEVLTPEQKAKLDELMGDTFELREDDRFRGFRGREGRGGRGGRDGERRGDRGRERRGNSGDDAI